MSRGMRTPDYWLALVAALALGAAAAGGAAPGDTPDGAADTMVRVMNSATHEKPICVTRLETAYGGPSQAGFGSAVFVETLGNADDLADAALSIYRRFVGALWERYGEAAWMGPWKEVHARKADVKPDIVAELRGIVDRDARLSVPMILDNVEGAEAARAALSGAFDDPAVTELRVFNLGDGAAMSGLLVAARCGSCGGARFLVFLMD